MEMLDFKFRILNESRLQPDKYDCPLGNWILEINAELNVTRKKIWI